MLICQQSLHAPTDYPVLALRKHSTMVIMPEVIGHALEGGLFVDLPQGFQRLHHIYTHTGTHNHFRNVATVML